MSRSSNPVPASVRASFEADKQHLFRRDKRMSMERVAELHGTTPATLYKWIETDTMPVKALVLWQHITESLNVVRYLASREGAVVISIPPGRRTEAQDVQLLQATLHTAVGALLDFMGGRLDRDATLGQLGAALESLAWHRDNVRKADQPELEF